MQFKPGKRELLVKLPGIWVITIWAS